MLSQCIYIYCLRHTAAQRNSNQVRSKYKDEQISDDVRYLNKFHVKLNIWVALDAYSNAHIIALNSMFWAIMYNVYIIHVFFLAYLFLHITYIFSSSTSRFLSKMTYLPPSSPLPPSLLLPLLLIVCLGYLCLYYRCVRFFFLLLLSNRLFSIQIAYFIQSYTFVFSTQFCMKRFSEYSMWYFPTGSDRSRMGDVYESVSQPIYCTNTRCLLYARRIQMQNR